MSVSLVIPCLDIYGRVIRQWEIIKVRNTTLFIPKDGAVYEVADIDSRRDKFLGDFLKIGDYLFKHYGDTHEPLLRSKLRNQHKEFEERITWSDTAVERLLSDDNFPYLCGDNQEVMQMIFDFISEYGYSTPKKDEVDVDIMAQRKWSEWLRKELSINLPPHAIMGASFLIYEFIGTFIALRKPEHDYQRIVQLYGEDMYEEVVCGLKLSMHQVYNITKKQFETSYTVFGIMDYLSMLLVLINSGETQQKIETCSNCKKSFLSSNPSAIYCSSACRNRANVKKSYYRKKDGDPHA